jgi:hypothetical protein
VDIHWNSECVLLLAILFHYFLFLVDNFELYLLGILLQDFYVLGMIGLKIYYSVGGRGLPVYTEC